MGIFRYIYEEPEISTFLILLVALMAALIFRY